MRILLPLGLLAAAALPAGATAVRAPEAVFGASHVSPQLLSALGEVGRWASGQHAAGQAITWSFLARQPLAQLSPAQRGALSPLAQALTEELGPLAGPNGQPHQVLYELVETETASARKREILAAMGRARERAAGEAGEALGSLVRAERVALGDGGPATEELAAALRALVNDGGFGGAPQPVLSYQIARAVGERSDAEADPAAARGEAPRPIVGDSAKLQELIEKAKRFARKSATVLIQGESGTGKELVARAVHDHSAVAAKPFVPINLAAIPETLVASTLFGHKKGAFTGADRDEPGAIKKASGGTLFLDEIGELPLSAQASLLRYLQEHEIQPVGKPAEVLAHPPRLVASTNRDLLAEVGQGRFRADLYYRLNILPLRTVALRDRKEDIPALAEHFARKHQDGEVKTLTPEALARLQEHHWPGNVRELESVIVRAIALSDDKRIPAKSILLDGAPAPADGDEAIDGGRLDAAFAAGTPSGHPMMPRLVGRYVMIPVPRSPEQLLPYKDVVAAARDLVFRAIVTVLRGGPAFMSKRKIAKAMGLTDGGFRERELIAMPETAGAPEAAVPDEP